MSRLFERENRILRNVRVLVINSQSTMAGKEGVAREVLEEDVVVVSINGHDTAFHPSELRVL